jgi:hypothetical protein
MVDAGDSAQRREKVGSGDPITDTGNFKRERNTIMTLIRKQALIAAAVAGALAVTGAYAQKPVVYPAKGQSEQQQKKDDGACYGWAKTNTGIDPAVVAQTPPPPSGPAVGGGERLKGAARGAIVGEAVGNNAGGGAAAGAVVGGARARKNQAAQQQQAQGQQQQTMDTFYRAYGACMEGRGYTVK